MRGALHIWTVYERPADYPHGYVARLFLVSDGFNGPTPNYKAGATLDAVRRLLPPGLHRMPRAPQDDPNIVESWL